MLAPAPRLALMALWNRNKDDCRSIGAIMDDARSGRLPGVMLSRFGFDVLNEDAALAAMRKDVA